MGLDRKMTMMMAIIIITNYDSFIKKNIE